MVSYHIPMETLRAEVEKFKGGNITNCFEKWANITQDQFVLNIVKFGLTMEFAKVPLCQFVPPLNSSPGETEIIDAEISKLLSKGVIVNTTREPNDYVSSIFTRTKKNGSYRMILNLKTFNEFFKFKHCKLESIEDALDLITEGCYFGSVDMKDAYYSVSIHENSETVSIQKYLKLSWKKECYQYVVPPNGFSPAVRVFPKVLTPPFKYMRSKGHLSVKYSVNSLLLWKTFDICLKSIRAIVALSLELGFTIHPEKSVLVPTQQIIFLGFEIDSVKMTITLTEEMKQSIYMLCENILSNYQASIRDLAQTIGVIVSSFRAVPYGPMYYRELEKCKVQSLARSGGDFNRKTYISEEAADELQWLIRNIFDAFAPIKFPPFDLTIFFDASLEGWGDTNQVTEIRGRWNCMENKCHINSLELQAAFLCLKAFCKNKTRLHVLLKLDNTTAVAYINKKGGTISSSCNKLAKEIWNWAKGQDI